MGALISDKNWEDRASDPGFAELSRDLKTWLEPKRYSLETRRWLDGGSGSHVLVVRKTPVGKRRHFDDMVLKLIPPDIGEAETGRVRAAGQSEPADFRRARLVEVDEDDRLPGRRWWIHLQKVAGGNLDQMRTLAELLDKPGLDGYCGAIVKSLMTEWNDDAVPSPAEKPMGFLQGFLEDRLKQKHVHSFARREGITLDGSQPITFPGRNTALENPLNLVTGLKEEWQANEEIIRGNSHGDLHAGNLLIPVRRSNNQAMAAKYQLIDLGRFDDDGPVSHDPMRLLLSIATAWLPSLVAYSAIRSNLAELVVSPASHPPSAPVVGYLKVAKEIHGAAERWAAEGHTAGHAWYRQNLLVLLGCALRYFAREKLSDADRWWYLEVAALAMRELVRGNDLEGGRITSPTESCALERTPPRDSPATGQQSRDVIDNVIEFPGPRAVPDPVLLLTDLANGIDRLQPGTSESRLAVLAINLEESAKDLADALKSTERIGRIRNELITIRALLAECGDCHSPNETVHELHDAGERLRSHGRRRWPGKVG